MDHLTRRHVLVAGAAVLAATALPAKAKVVTGLDLASGPDRSVSWIAGTDGDNNWQFIRAVTKDDAARAWVEEAAGSFECDDGGEPGAAGKEECECEACEAFRNVDVDRMKRWDHFDYKNQPRAADWLHHGMNYICDRCGEETGGLDGGAKIIDISQAEFDKANKLYNYVGDNVLCEECHDRLQRDREHRNEIARLVAAGD